MTPLALLLTLSVLMFTLGLFAVLARRKAILVLVGIELMLNAANLNFIAFWRYGPPDPATCRAGVRLVFDCHRGRRSRRRPGDHHDGLPPPARHRTQPPRHPPWLKPSNPICLSCSGWCPLLPLLAGWLIAFLPDRMGKPAALLAIAAQAAAACSRLPR